MWTIETFEFDGCVQKFRVISHHYLHGSVGLDWIGWFKSFMLEIMMMMMANAKWILHSLQSPLWWVKVNELHAQAHTHIHAHTLNRTIQTAKKISHNCFECIDDTYTLVNRIVDAIIIPPFGLVIIQSMPLSLSFHRSFSFSCGNFGCFFPFANSLQKWTETIVRFYSHSRKHRIWHAER